MHEYIGILIRTIPKFIFEDLIDRKSYVLQVTACRWPGDKLLPAPMLTIVFDVIRRP